MQDTWVDKHQPVISRHSTGHHLYSMYNAGRPNGELVECPDRSCGQSVRYRVQGKYVSYKCTGCHRTCLSQNVARDKESTLGRASIVKVVFPPPVHRVTWKLPQERKNQGIPSAKPPMLHTRRSVGAFHSSSQSTRSATLASPPDNAITRKLPEGGSPSELAEPLPKPPTLRTYHSTVSVHSSPQVTRSISLPVPTPTSTPSTSSLRITIPPATSRSRPTSWMRDKTATPTPPPPSPHEPSPAPTDRKRQLVQETQPKAGKKQKKQDK